MRRHNARTRLGSRRRSARDARRPSEPGALHGVAVGLHVQEDAWQFLARLAALGHLHCRVGEVRLRATRALSPPAWPGRARAPRPRAGAAQDDTFVPLARRRTSRCVSPACGVDHDDDPDDPAQQYTISATPKTGIHSTSDACSSVTLAPKPPDAASAGCARDTGAVRCARDSDAASCGASCARTQAAAGAHSWSRLDASRAVRRAAAAALSAPCCAACHPPRPR